MFAMQKQLMLSKQQNSLNILEQISPINQVPQSPDYFSNQNILFENDK